ncbi:MAG TPA: 4Fe-4S dicluster domain-containing protein [Acidobacteriota bacterium]|nr:4Fe-4S dicluster domain-containing protein [Acidobacteriota bacterium]
MSDGSPAGQSASKPAAQTKYDYSEGPLPLNINLKWCKACNLCIALCPKQVFEPDRDGRPVQARPENCTQCTICWVHCPDLAITSNYK